MDKSPLPLICLRVDFVEKSALVTFIFLMEIILYPFLHIINAVKIILLKCKMHQVLSIPNRSKLWEPNGAKHIQDKVVM